MTKYTDNDAIKAQLQKERDKMARSIRESSKYFVDPSTRTFVPKGWGWEDWICNNELYCGKMLFVKKGRKCSFHYHNKKDETFSVVSGKLHVLYSTGDDLENACEIVLMPGDAFHVPPGLRHQFTGLLDTEFIEFSTQHFDEDSIRIAKGD
jgi:mannose-6-phosphate isomerase-like protein (cupin superfamily)